MRAELLLALFAAGPLWAAPAGNPAPAKSVSADKSFAFSVPAGYQAKIPDRGVAGWEKAPEKVPVIGLFAASAKLTAKHGGSPLKAARAAQIEAVKADERKVWQFGDVYKKDLPNGLTVYFYSGQRVDGSSPNQKVAGYLSIGGSLYQLTGWLPITGGYTGLYELLGTLEPIRQPKAKGRKLTDGTKPEILRDQEQKSQGVALE